MAFYNKVNMTILVANALAVRSLQAKNFLESESLLKLCFNKEIDNHDINAIRIYCAKVKARIGEYNDLANSKNPADIRSYNAAQESNKLCNLEAEDYAYKLKINCASKLGGLYYQNNNTNNAMVFYQKAYNLQPHDAIYFIDFVTTLLDYNHYKEAELELTKCFKTIFYFPNQLSENILKASCAANLALIYSEEKLDHPYHDKATLYFQMAQELDSNKSDYLHNLAMHYYNNNYTEAKSLLKECANINDNYDYVKECSYYLFES